jgi:hypothetical protein
MLKKQLEKQERKAQLEEKKLEKQSHQLCERLVALQAEHSELLDSIIGPKVTSMKLMKTGTINGEACEIRGFVPRAGKGSKTNPPGPCMNCSVMLGCKTTDQMLRVGMNCPYIGCRGHIVKLPAEVKQIV